MILLDMVYVTGVYQLKQSSLVTKKSSQNYRQLERVCNIQKRFRELKILTPTGV